MNNVPCRHSSKPWICFVAYFAGVMAWCDNGHIWGRGEADVADGELFVTDWEWVKPEGGPWEDFRGFLMSTGFNTAPDGSNKRRVPENLLSCLQDKSVHSDFISRASTRFLDGADLPSYVLLAGLLPTVAYRVIRDFEQHGLSPDASLHISS